MHKRIMYGIQITEMGLLPILFFGEIGRIRILFVWMISFILFLQVCIMSQVVQSLFLRI